MNTPPTLDEFPLFHQDKNYIIRKHRTQDTRIVWRIYSDKHVFRGDVIIPSRYTIDRVIELLSAELAKKHNTKLSLLDYIR